MRYKQRRRLYSQNCLYSPKLITKLIRNSSIGKSDIILEIGPGRGNITQELLKFAGRIIAVEIDIKLYLGLKDKFRKQKNLMLINSDFLGYPLPNYQYKVFANIPFKTTSDIIRKLTSDRNFQEGYLVVQKEAAKRFIGMPYDTKNSMPATLLKPWFEITIFWNFKRSDFIPRPNVDSVMIKIKRLENLLIPDEQKTDFRDYVLYIYNRRKVARFETRPFINMFNDFVVNAGKKEKEFVRQEAKKILVQQGKLRKIKRTRKDRNWRKYG